MTGVELNPPDERQCLLCGREDVWDDEDGEWRVRIEDGEKLTGTPYCLHEWDVTGTHKPILE